MENFYAVLALHIAGKALNKQNVKAVLAAAGTPVDEPGLDTMAAFIASLETAHPEKTRQVSPRVIRLLASEMDQWRVQAQLLKTAVAELAGPARPGPACSPAQDNTAPAISLPQDKGRYVYGITTGAENIRLGAIGIEGSAVYTIPFRGICAVVHNCPAMPYRSGDEETVKGWVETHQGVLDRVKERFGTVVPMGFDTILKPQSDAVPPDQVVTDWLEEDYPRLRKLLGDIEGKDEYVVQVCYEPEALAGQVAEQSEEIRRIRDEVATRTPGMAYLYRQKLEKAVKAGMERMANERFRDFYHRIKKYVDSIIVEKVGKADRGKVMLLNVSCLVAGGRVAGLGEELEGIERMDGFSVHFSGPWPPYSFVAKFSVLAQDK